MIRAVSNVRTLAAIAETPVLTLGVPEGKTYKLLEIRTPVTVLAQTYTDIFVNGDRRFRLVPTVTDNVITVDEDIAGSSSIDAVQIKETATGQILGITFVYDDGE